ncbi:MAG: hypothetical protein A3F72_17905 [Bacteroidetes bacterium RIFCSPLOWO2_12_FULL_35_15]|nr:MAG: hypothetical protein A3F72_17905 [Bacteroidetes bacterium RIFCSPLOWO2_12_FULL_35_15]
MRLRLLFIFITFLFLSKSYSQCDPDVPTFNVDLTGSPAGTWFSPNISRNGNCCGTSFPNTCIDFIITLDPGAVGINFDIFSGAVPGGALFYQINCGPQTALGSPICLSGVGPHLLTFCKPGNNPNVYQITSIPPAIGGTNIVINDGCIGQIIATGFNTSTVAWNSIYPGAPGTYNSYLSCTSNCLNPIVTPTGAPPSYIDYVICGQPASLCNFSTVCDTVRVTFNPTLAVNIIPINPTICFGQTSTTITAIGSGGTPPYSYLWNNVNPSQSINVGAGTYTVELSDVSGCPPTYNSVTVTSFSVTITANAGPDQTLCSQTTPHPVLNGSVTGASGGIWSGGAGSFSPNNTTLTAVYTPTATEIASGAVSLTLTTTGNGTCPPASDIVTINFSGFTGVVTAIPNNVSCFSGNNGSATVSVAGGTLPFTYTWNTVPIQTTATATNLTQGTYTATIQNGIGCIYTIPVTITQPPPLALSSVITNVSCAGGNNGSIAITPAGGTPPYAYLWSGGATVSTLSGQIAGTYTVTVTDSKGCTISSTYLITQPFPLVISFTQTNLNCYNGNNGTANSTVTGGTAPYSYSWSPSGGTAANSTGLVAGTYTLTVIDSKGCSLTNTVTITQPVVLAASTSVTNEACNYLNNGTATSITTGGTPFYSYLWQPGGFSTSTITGLASGTYTLTVTDSKGCTAITFAAITEPPVLIMNSSQVNVSCFGGNNGSASASPSGGTPNYSYSWIPGGGTSSTVSGLPAGTYTVTVTDNNGCQVQNSVSITQPLLPVSLSPIISNVSCFDGANGSISVTPNGGTAPYTFLWLPNGQIASSIAGQTAGTYTVTVTDSKGCQLTSNYSITQPLPLAITFTKTTVNCFGGSNGTASSTVTGGTPGFTYSWTPSGGSGPNATGLQAGTYTLTVTDVKGCIVSNTVTITQPSALTASTSVTNETCNYLNNGTATALPLGGTPAYTYSWLPGGFSSSTITGLSSGTYTLTVTDSKGCASLATAIITQPAPLAITFSSQINVSCFGGNNGSVSAIPSGGTPNYSYFWTPGGASTNSISGLSAGTYTLTITDNNNCTFQNMVTITQPVSPLAVAVSSTPAACYGGSTGSVTAVGSGGTGPYTYNWIPGNLSGQTISGLTAGTYTVTAMDSKGCLSVNTVIVNQPSQILPVTSTINSNCGSASGQASVTVTGGSPPYTYLWSPGGATGSTANGLFSGGYTVIVTDANGCTAIQFANVNDNSGPTATIFSIINVNCYGGSDGAASVGVSGGIGPFTYSWAPTGGNAPTAIGLTAGIYSVTVNDAATGCQSIATTTPAITQPPPITISIISSSVNCFGGTNGSATATASGGSPGYTYQWLPGGTGGPTVTGLSAGTFTVEVTDTHSCIQPSTYTISQPATAVSVGVSSTPVSCFGGSNGTISAVAVGGTPPYNYGWMPGNYTGATISGLPIGTYTVTVTDLNGCTSTNTIAVTQPTAIALTTSSISSNCSLANGQTTVNATGGTPSYTYQWMPSGGTGNSAFGVLSGSYTVTVTDGNGCIANASVLVNDNQGPTASVASVTNVSCYNGSNGTATASVSGGAGPFSYLWSPMGGVSQTATGLPVGTYSVVITDANGCQSLPAVSPVVTQPSPIIISVTTTSVSCFGGNNGTATVSASGGTSGYSYLWLPGTTSGTTITGLSANTYTIQVTDANSCIQTMSYTISQPTQLLATIFASSPVSCFGGNNGSATVGASGGTAYYSYNWLPSGGSNATGSGLSAGTYTVNVTDFQGCTTSATVLITEPALALSAAGTGSATSCFGGSNGTTTVNPVGGTPGYIYLWSPIGGTGQTATGLSPGNYTVLITDANSCQTNTAIVVSQPTQVTGTLISINPSCGLNNGSVSSMISGGTGPYTYLWTPGSSTSSSISGVGPGSYSLQVTDALNCIKTITITLTNIAGPSVSIISQNNVFCFGGNNGNATANITSGTAPFSITWSPYGGNTITGTGFTVGTYTVNVTDALGCIASASVTITQPSAVNVSVSSLTSVSCNGGNNGTITVSGSGGTPGYSYSWSPITSSSSTVTNLIAGTYTVNVSDTKSCTASISMTITQPTIMSSSVGGLVNPTCFSSNNGSATVNITGGTLPYSYLWSNGQTGSTATNLVAGFYIVTITDANSCITTNSALLTQPAQVITTAGINDTICFGSSGSVSATASGGAGNYNYTWQPSGAINAGTFNVTPTANTTYTVIAYDQVGCAGTPDTVSAIVYHLTGANIDAIAYSPICPGASSVVYVTTSGVTGPLTYSWNNNLGNGPGGYSVTPSQPTTYIVTVSNTCGTSVTDSVQILFNPPPTMLLFPDSSFACVPSSVQFYDNSISGNINDPITSWFWTFGDGNTSTLQDPTHVYTIPGNYTVTVTVTTNGGCTNNNSSSPLLINAFPFPIAAFSVNSTNLDLPYDILVCTNQSVGANSYLWNFGDGGASTATNPQYLYSSVGIFPIMLIATSQYGCSDTAYSEVTTNADVIFPNVFTPNTDESTGGFYDIASLTNDVFFPYTSGVVDFKFQIFNRWGELIFETFDIKQGWDGYYRGKLCQQDVYVWKAYLKLNNDKTFNKTGDVTLLR